MLRHVVEGEPGIFPEPVARIMRGIGGLFQRKPKAEADQPAPETPAPPADPPDPDDQSGAAR